MRSGSRMRTVSRLSRRLRLLTAVLAMTASSFVAAGLQDRTTAVTIDGGRRFQVLDGVGVNINSLSWRGGEARAAIDRLAGDMGVTLWRVVFDMED
jgi:hypothetical protein